MANKFPENVLMNIPIPCNCNYKGDGDDGDDGDDGADDGDDGFIPDGSKESTGKERTRGFHLICFYLF